MTLLPAFDPVLGHAGAAFIAALLLSAAWHKLRDLALFRAVLDNYRLLPTAWLPAAALALPVAEATVGVLLLPLETRAAAGWGALALLALVTTAVVINLQRGRARIDCGCGGTEQQPLSWGLVARNAVLGLLCLVIAAPTTGRATVWLDLAASLLATLFALGLYALVNQLLANHPRLLDLRNHP
jgi:hypothetical protein